VAPPSKKPARPGGTASRQGGITSRPLRYLAALVALVVIMLGSVIGSTYALHPGQWHNAFKVGLGLDLSSGTAVTLHAVAPNGKPPTKAAMNTAIGILTSRVNGQGFTGASVVQLGASDITVSIPHKSAEQVAPLLQSAVLRFRQVLLVAPGYPVAISTPVPTPTPTPTPSGSSSPGAKTSASPKASASAKASAGAKASPSPTASASGKAATRSSGRGQAIGSRVLSGGSDAAAKPSASASAKPSASATASPSPSASGSPSPTATPTPSTTVTTGLPTTADAQGDVTMVHSAAVIKDFNRLNCRHKNWQAQIYGNNPNNWDAPNQQIVSCDPQGQKYVLDVAKVLGDSLTTVNASLNSTNQWVVNFNLKSVGAKAFATLTTMMYDNYYKSSTQTQNVLDDFAIVLDGKTVSAPQIIQPITTGQSEITGGGSGFTQGQANQLASVLKYGAVPLAFRPLTTTSVSAQLGSAQLTAGLIAAAIGLLLVVIYSFLYYRGLGLVSVSSLAIAALLSWLSVILLSRFEHFTLSLAGVAGLIVAIGITADSFVVYFERLRDEVREGRSLRAAVERGWQRARRTILVSDTVSFLAAALLYIFAIGDVKGFAFTLGLTTMIDIVVVFLFTKPMVTLLARTKFYGQGHRLSGLDPARLGAKSPWRGSRSGSPRPVPGTATAMSALAARTTPKEA
jgi:preprotein translocase subunit SecD